MNRFVFLACVSFASAAALSGCIGNRMGSCSAGQTCICDGIGNCDQSCPGGNCDFICRGIGNCVIDCEGGGCDVSCRGTGETSCVLTIALMSGVPQEAKG